jgi:hypothetical protein
MRTVAPMKPPAPRPGAFFIALSLALLVTQPALAQGKVYKCETGGRVIYADRPCEGGRELDVHGASGRPAEPEKAAPTPAAYQAGAPQYADKAAAQERMKTFLAELKRFESEPARPMSRTELRRYTLSVADKRACAELDQVLKQLQAEERVASPARKEEIGKRLVVERDRHMRTGC